jgi:hypothetical protein
VSCAPIGTSSAVLNIKKINEKKFSHFLSSKKLKRLQFEIKFSK